MSLKVINAKADFFVLTMQNSEGINMSTFLNLLWTNLKYIYLYHYLAVIRALIEK